MNDKHKDYDDEQSDLLEQFLDNKLSKEEAEKFFADAENPEWLLQEKELQTQIDDALSRIFKFEPTDHETLAEQIVAQTIDAKQTVETKAELEKTDSSKSSKSETRRQLLKLALAAGLLVALGMSIWTLAGNQTITARFEPRPLEEVYIETNKRGFEPYYNCEDMDRFADTFESRQGQRLTLKPMQAETRMLGLSYLGGTSRTSTAMLGKVDDTPVIVIVDRVENRKNITRYVANKGDPNLNVFVEEKDGLIFCEVTPLDSARMIEYFEFAK